MIAISSQNCQKRKFHLLKLLEAQVQVI